MKVYLCGPMAGLTFEQAKAWRTYVKVRMPLGTECLSPLRGKDKVLGKGAVFSPEGEPVLLCRPSEILARDSNDVRNCDVILANFVGATEVSVGSVMEIGMGYVLGKYIVVAMSPTNPHRHAFIEACASVVVETLDEAIHCVRSFGER